MVDIQDRFGDSPARPGGALQVWRNALSLITDSGRLNGFSSNFTRRVGLEIVTPIIGDFRIDTMNPSLHQPITVSWDCSRNPPLKDITLEIQTPNPIMDAPERHSGRQVRDTYSISASEMGEYVFTLIATSELNSQPRESRQSLIATVT